MDAVETMMFLNQVPWHGKGTLITEDDAYDFEKCIKYSGLDWEVETKPCFIELENPDSDFTIIKPVDAYATVRKSDSTVLGIVGERYEILQNKEAFKVFQPLLDNKLIRLNTAGSLYDGKKIWILAEIVGDPLFVSDNDLIRKFILLSHGHDGKSVVRYGLTPIRVVCANTLSMAINHKENKLAKFRHTKNVINNLNEMTSFIDEMNHLFNESVKYYKMLNEVNINRDQLDSYVKSVFNIKNDEDISTRQFNIIERVKSYFTHAPGAQGQSLWDSYNAITYYLSHEYANNVDNRLNALWFGKSFDMNQYALEIALGMVNDE